MGRSYTLPRTAERGSPVAPFPPWCGVAVLPALGRPAARAGLPDPVELLRMADAPGLAAGSAPGGTFGRRGVPDGASEAWQATQLASIIPPAARSTRREMADRPGAGQLSLSTWAPGPWPSRPVSSFSSHCKAVRVHDWSFLGTAIVRGARCPARKGGRGEDPRGRLLGSAAYPFRTAEWEEAPFMIIAVALAHSGGCPR